MAKVQKSDEPKDVAVQGVLYQLPASIQTQADADAFVRANGYEEGIVTEDRCLYSPVDHESALNHCIYRGLKIFTVKL